MAEPAHAGGEPLPTRPLPANGAGTEGDSSELPADGATREAGSREVGGREVASREGSRREGSWRDGEGQSTPELVAGRYRVLAKLGGGGQAQVYRAFDERFHQIVALKIYLTWSLDPEEVEPALAEARRLSKLKHPNIVAMIDAGPCVWDGGPATYLAMEEVAGALSLKDYCEQRGCSVSDRCRLLAGLADGLAYLHSRAFVHRDVKPSNVLVTPDGVVKLVDLGIALERGPLAGKVVDPRSGTAHYMAPEQARGDGDAVGFKVDLYALGVVGRELFAGLDIEWEMEALLAQLMAPRPEKRPGSAERVAARLRAIAARLEPRETGLWPSGQVVARWAISAAAAVLAVRFVVRPVDAGLELSRRSYAAVVAHVPQRSGDELLKGVVCLVLEGGDKPEALGAAIGHPEVTKANFRSYRLLHAAVLRRVAAARPGAVAVDIFFRVETDFDRPLIEALEKLQCPVVLQLPEWPGGGVSGQLMRRQVTVARRFRRFQQAPATFAPGQLGLWELDVALALPGQAPMLSLAAVTAAMYRRSLLEGTDAGDREGAATRPADLSALGATAIRAVPPAIAAGQVPFAVSHVGPARKSLSVKMGSPVTVATVQVTLPNEKEIGQRVLSYTKFLSLSDTEVMRLVSGQVIVLANSRQEGDNPEPIEKYADGRELPAYLAHAAGISSLLNRAPPHLAGPIRVGTQDSNVRMDTQVLAECLAAVGGIYAVAAAARRRRRWLAPVAGLAVLGTLAGMVAITWWQSSALLSLPLLVAAAILGAGFFVLWSFVGRRIELIRAAWK